MIEGEYYIDTKEKVLLPIKGEEERRKFKSCSDEIWEFINSGQFSSMIEDIRAELHEYGDSNNIPYYKPEHDYFFRDLSNPQFVQDAVSNFDEFRGKLTLRTGRFYFRENCIKGDSYWLSLVEGHAPKVTLTEVFYKEGKEWLLK